MGTAVVGGRARADDELREEPCAAGADDVEDDRQRPHCGSRGGDVRPVSGRADEEDFPSRSVPVGPQVADDGDRGPRREPRGLRAPGAVPLQGEAARPRGRPEPPAGEVDGEDRRRVQAGRVLAEEAPSGAPVDATRREAGERRPGVASERDDESAGRQARGDLGPRARTPREEALGHRHPERAAERADERSPSRCPCSRRPARRPTTRRRSARGPTWWSRRRSLQSDSRASSESPPGKGPWRTPSRPTPRGRTDRSSSRRAPLATSPVVRATAVASPQPSGRRRELGRSARIRGRYRVRERRATAERGRDRPARCDGRVERDDVGDDRRRARTDERRPA